MTNLNQNWLVVGASGLLGRALCEHLVARGHQVFGVCHGHDIGVAGAEEKKIDLLGDDWTSGSLVDETQAEVIVYAAGITNVDACEQHETLARAMHATIPSEMASAAAGRGVRFVYISTDHLWDGTRAMITEDTPVNPINAYARTKAEGDRGVLEKNPASLVLRTNFYGLGHPWRTSIAGWIVTELSQGSTIKAFGDAYFTPICLASLCGTLVELVERNAEGVYNVAGPERLSKYEFAVRLARAFDLDGSLIQESSLVDAGLVARRPLDLSLSTAKVAKFLGRNITGLDECLERLKSQPSTTSVNIRE